jgi:hypothetical protein
MRPSMGNGQGQEAADGCGSLRVGRQHSTAQHSTAQHSTAQHSTAQHSTAQHSTAQHSTAQHSTHTQAWHTHTSMAHTQARHTHQCYSAGTGTDTGTDTGTETGTAPCPLTVTADTEPGGQPDLQGVKQLGSTQALHWAGRDLRRVGWCRAACVSGRTGTEGRALRVAQTVVADVSTLALQAWVLLLWSR